MGTHSGESSDLVHERLHTFGNLLHILVFGSVEIELRDTVWSSRHTLELRVSIVIAMGQITNESSLSSRKEPCNPRRDHFRGPKEALPCPLERCWREDIAR